MDDLTFELDKIRAAQKSKIPAQSRAAHLLLAIDETLKESNHAPSPTFYFASLLATLQSFTERHNSSQRDATAAAAYLLGLVAPFVSPAVLVAKSDVIIAVLEHLYKSLMLDEDSAPITKSALAIFQATYSALPSPTLNRIDVSQLYNSTLPLLSDIRPKVKRRAQEAVQAVVFTARNTAEADKKQKAKPHPYAQRTAEWIIAALEENTKVARKLASGGAPSGPLKKPEEAQSRLMGLIAFVKMIAGDWPSEQLKHLISTLLSLPKTGNNFLTRASYDVLEILFTKTVTTSLPVLNTLEELIALQPAPTASVILPGWLGAVEHGFVALASSDAAACRNIFYKNFANVMTFCSSASSSIDSRQRAEKTAIGMIRWCLDISEAEVTHAAKSKQIENDRHPLAGVCQLLLEALSGIKYRGVGMPHVFGILSQLVSKLRLRFSIAPNADSKDPRPPTAASLLLSEHVQLVGGMRAVTTFEYKEAAESVLGMACEVCGPRWLMDVLPLHLLDESQDPSVVGRAWLLPVLRGRVSNTTLSHFVNDLVPLSEKLFAKKLESGTGKAAEIQVKVFEALVDQIWALVPGYCDLPVDLEQAFNKQFAELLSQLLYNQHNLRPIIFRSLQTLVEKNAALATSSTPAEVSLAAFGIDQQKAKANMKLLGTAAPTLLSVMFNVYSKANRETSGYMLDSISAYFGVLSAKEVVTIHGRIAGLLKPALIQANNQKSNGDKAQVSSAYAMLDIMIALAAVAQGPTAHALYDMATGTIVLDSSDATVQKKGYRILLRLFDSKAAATLLRSKMHPVLQLLGEKVIKPAASARKDRLELLRRLVDLMPEDQLHLLLPILSEAILATKEANEKSRAAGFDLVVLMARKMQAGGTLNRSLIPGMESSMDTDVETKATLSEFFTMVSAGLTSSPHMISATVTALSRLLFDFHADLDAGLVDDLIKTVIVFLHSKTREVVKSALGFVKVTIVSLPPSALSAHLADLIAGLLNWSSDHKNHFNVKVRHIFERLIRRHGFDTVAEHVGADHQKLMQNIRKRQMRAKRKKIQREDDEEGRVSSDDERDRAAAPRQGFQSAFDEAIQDSESDISASSDDGQPNANARKSSNKQRKSKQRQQDSAFLPDDDGDTPMNLLDHTQLSRVMVKQPRKAKAKVQESDDVQIDAKGRLIVKDDKQNVDSDLGASTNAYLEAIRGEDGFNRDSRGNLRANKAQKRGRDEIGEDDDQWVDDVEGKLRLDSDKPAKKRKKNGKEAIGSEFKAKKAGGDVKKNGQQPYAYVPLQKVAGKRKRTDVAFVKKGRNLGSKIRKP